MLPIRAMTDFDEAWSIAAAIPGWLTREQAEVLWRAARALPAGAQVVEIGSHRGRSTVVLGHAARAAGARVTAVDPFVAGRLFGGASTREHFERSIALAGLTGTVRLVCAYSTALRRSWTEPIGLLYIDGKHDYWTFTDDLRWSAHLPPGGQVLVHDCFSSVGVTSGVLAKVVLGDRHVYLDRTGSLARFRVGSPTAEDRVRVLKEMPWFLRNVGLKALLRLRMHPVARALGHEGPYDPY
jgi:predicted O-methyltransferase YrrM